MEWMGASELLISWLSTRTSRCHACRSSSRSAWLRSASTSSWWRWPALPEGAAAHLPAARCRRGRRAGRCAAPRRAGTRPAPAARPPAPGYARPGAPSSRSPARFTSRSRPSALKAKTATSISAITVRSSAAASRFPSRCSRRVAPACWPRSAPAPARRRSARPPRGWRSRPSRRVKRRFDRVCSGRTTCERTAPASPTAAASRNAVSPARSQGANGPVHSSTSAVAVAGSAVSSASRNTRCWCRRGRRGIVNEEGRGVPAARGWRAR